MASGLIDIMKRTSMDAMHNAQMCDLRYGKVVSTDPLKIQVTNLFTIPESLLVVPQHLTKYKVKVSLEDFEEGETKTLTVYNQLKVDDKVALLRKQGGQSYFILDRV